MQHQPAGIRRNFHNKIVACHRCHAKKIKCSGGKPCQNCLQAEKAPECSYPLRNRMVKVPQRFIDGLYQEINSLNQCQNATQAGDNHPSLDHGPHHEDYASRAPFIHPTPDPAGSGRVPESNANSQPICEEGESQVNATLNEAPWFDNRNVFDSPIFISEAADAAFATRFRQVIADPDAPEPTHLLRLNYANTEALMALSESGASWPSQARARFLLEAALKFIGRCCYVVCHDAARQGLSQIYIDRCWGGPVVSCKYWALFSLGELYATRTPATQSYPGMAYFAQASKMLAYLDERPGTDTIETLLLLSIYSLALNRRYSAYIMSGTAMRSAIVMGLHLNISDTQLPDVGAREHRKRLFWTTYMFDRLWGANLGHPAAIQDDEIEVDLPSTRAVHENVISHDDFDSEYYTASVKLVGHLTNVIRSIYTVRRHNHDTQLSARVHQALHELQAWMDQLPSRLQIVPRSGASHDWKLVSLHLSFYQSVILATRPILLHTLRVQVAAAGSPGSSAQVPMSASALSEACIRCARHSVQLLAQSWIDGSFVTFDCFFTQYLFSSLTVLAISSLLYGSDSQDDRGLFEEATRLLLELKEAGNCVAQEYCHHVDVIETALAAYAKRILPLQATNEPVPEVPPDMDTDSTTSQLAPDLPRGVVPMAGVPWTESSLQQLLSQPALDMQFLEDAVRDTYSQGLY
ncbi:hypothetical protein P170DRAFT_383081 [Aspergillus steynii IBT 23096]|uniref:Zn(2)-C6 fungal-type domain-containing protein n=1 Tax=Aspergillus steynii IBT 23096 TaxID=1392250 RepID=A0A2I2G7C5_9EURO|nr:uncharacterized protein P170DRAFT_383081 [Aspergillus steynii IBT 23096]PLB48786.1 hypothetical protein P170DRAFT_383081 [Aspergillus steynii IBT 23096]